MASELSSGVVMIVFNGIILGLRGNTGVAAYGVIANLSLVVIAVYTGIAQGMQPLLSKYYGLAKKVEIRTVFRYGAITVIVLSILLYGGMFAGAQGITSILTVREIRNCRQWQCTEYGFILLPVFLPDGILLYLFFLPRQTR